MTIPVTSLEMMYRALPMMTAWRFHLKNNKAAGPNGLSNGLFKTGSKELVGRLHQFIHKMWLEESMSIDWKLSVLYPVLKKGEPIQYVATTEV